MNLIGHRSVNTFIGWNREQGVLEQPASIPNSFTI